VKILTPIELKEYITENNKQIELLEKLECRSIKPHETYFTCGRPNGKNNIGIQLYKQSLKVRIFTPDLQMSDKYTEENADILTLVMIIHDCAFTQASKWIHEQLGLEYLSYSKEKDKPKKANPLDIFTKHKKHRCDVGELQLIDNEILCDFIPYCHITWIKEGITPNIAEEFGIGYSEKRKRIIIPHRYWGGGENDFVGIIGRTILSQEMIDLFDIPKYFPIKAYSKSQNIYGLNENYKGIQSKNRVVVYEAEKSVLKRASRLDRTGVSVCCHSISETQVKILIGLKVNVVIAFDSDVPEELIWQECEKFYHTQDIYYIFDSYGVLKEKQSPADTREDVFKFLWKRIEKYDEFKHNKYIKWIENKSK
jgi:DNA primase